MDRGGPPQEPTKLAKFIGRVTYLGNEEMKVVVKDVPAAKYIIHLGPLPGVIVWLSESGIVLGSQNEELPEQKTELVRFHEFETLPKL